MKNKRALALSLFLTCLLTLRAWPQLYAGAGQILVVGKPVVHKIEPPNWWVNFTPEVTLLLTGENLSGARVESQTQGLTVLGVEGSANGHYLFVHLQLSSDLPAGTVPLQLITSAGSTTVPLPLLARTDSRGRFEGFSCDDVIYLIIPHRFADGDPSNDQPAGSNGAVSEVAKYTAATPGVSRRRPARHSRAPWISARSWRYHPVAHSGLEEYRLRLPRLPCRRFLRPRRPHGLHGGIPGVGGRCAPAGDEGADRLRRQSHRPTAPLGQRSSDANVVTWQACPSSGTCIHGKPAHHLEPAYTFTGLVDPHASPREYLNTLEGWFAGRLPDLNPDDPALALYLAQNSMWWTEMAQLDGFRLDTFPYSTRQFWSGWHERMRQVYPQFDYPQIMDIGEVSDRDPTVTSFFEGGRKQFDGIDSGVATVFDFPLRDALHDVVINGAPLERVVDILRQDELYPHPETLVTFIGNHDQTRFVSEKDSNPAKLKAAFGLLLTLRGIPQIYSGDEIAMPGGADPDNRRDFPGGFPGDRRNAFTPSGRTAEEQEVFAYVQSLLALRKNHAALRTGKQWHIGWGDTYYAFLRELPEEKLLVVYNNAPKTVALNIPVENTPLDTAHQLQTVFGNSAAEVVSGNVRVSLPSQTLSVFTVR